MQSLTFQACLVDTSTKYLTVRKGLHKWNKSTKRQLMKMETLSPKCRREKERFFIYSFACVWGGDDYKHPVWDTYYYIAVQSS